MVQLDAFDVAGIEVRTSFAREKEPGGAIPALWERFMKEGHRNGDIIALYSDYESDEYGEYTLLLGARVFSSADVPAGWILRHVPASQYAVFTSERGPVQRIVIDLWKRIWHEPRTTEYRRSYRADFEVYGAAAANPADSEVEIYVGVK
jgi:predicted transcriptional regulator YdeE